MKYMAPQKTEDNASPLLAHSITPYPGTVAAHYDCPCTRCIAGSSTHTRLPYGGRLSHRKDSLPPSVPYVEDTRHTITIVPPSGPYFLNDNVSYFSDDSSEKEQRRGVVRSRVSHVRAIAYRARASIDSIRKSPKQSNKTSSNDTQLQPILSSNKIVKEITNEIADQGARRGIQTVETEPMDLKRRMTAKEKVKRWMQSAETEPMGLKRRMTAKEKVKGWFHNIAVGDKVRSLGRKMSAMRGAKGPRKTKKPTVGLNIVAVCPHLAVAIDLPLPWSPPPPELAEMRFIIL